MEIRNASQRVIYIGDATCVPGDATYTIDDAWATHPILSAHIMSGDIKIVKTAKPAVKRQ